MADDGTNLISPQDLLSRAATSNNFLDTLADLKRRTDKLEQQELGADYLDEMTSRISEIRSMNFFSADQGYPDDGSYTGVFISNEPYVFSGDNINIGGMNNGVLQFGLSAVDGSALFAGGAGILDAIGLKLGGATDYLTGAGFFVGLNSGLYKLRIGNPVGDNLHWDGVNLYITGYIAGTIVAGGTNSDIWAINQDFTDANVDLVFARTTGGNATIRWDGSVLNSDKTLQVDGVTVVLQSRSIISGGGLTGGGDLSADRTLAVGAGTLITVNADDVAVQVGTAQYQYIVSGANPYTAAWSGGYLNITATKTLSVELDSILNQDLTTDFGPSFDHLHLTIATGTAPLVVASATMIANLNADTVDGIHGVGTAQYQFIMSGANPYTGAWTLVSTLAGAGLIAATGVLAVGAGLGLTVNADDVALTTPGTLTVATTNNSTGSHLHTITSSANPGAAASILASDANGYLRLVRLGIGVTPTCPLDVVGAAQIDGDLTFVGTQSILTTAGNLTLAPAADLVLTPAGTALVKLTSAVRIRSDNYVNQTTGWDISYAGSGDFRYLFADELHAKAFIADLEQALAGGQFIGKSVAPLAVAFTIPAAGANSTMVVESFKGFDTFKVFVDGDIVNLSQFARAGTSLTIANCWGTVAWVSTDTTAKTQTYTFTRSAAPNAGTAVATEVIAVGVMVRDYGTTGNGYLESNAIDGAMAEYAPYHQIVSWATHPATGLTVRTRLGNLKGIFGVANEYGLYAGAGILDASKYLRISDQAAELHNISLKMFDGAVNTVLLSPTAPSFAMGATLPTAYGTGVGIWMGKDTTYKFRVGDPAGQRLTWDGSNLTIIGNVTIGGVGANYGVNVGEALLLSHFDGPRPYETDFTGSPNGHRGQVATISGGVIYRPGKFGKAVQIAEATTNLVSNPSFEDAASPGWWATYNATLSREANGYIGTYCGRLTYSGAGEGISYGICDMGASIAGRTFTLQFRARLSSAGAFTPFGLCHLIAIGGDNSNATIDISGLTTDWQYYSVTHTMSAGAITNNLGVVLRPSNSAAAPHVEYDAVQIEEKAYATPYCDGSLGAGHTWSGTAHASTSSRTAAKLQYVGATGSINGFTGTILFPLQVSDAIKQSDSIYRPVILTLSSDMYFDAPGIKISFVNQYFIFEYRIAGHSDIPASPDISSWIVGDWHQIGISWSGTTLTAYLDGVSIGSCAFVGEAFTAADLTIGGCDVNGKNSNCLIDEFAILPVALSAAEIKAIYDSNAPLIAETNTGELRLMPSQTTTTLQGYVQGNANGLFGFSSTSGAVDTGSFALVAAATLTLGTEFGGASLVAGDLLLGSVSAGKTNLLLSANAINLRTATVSKFALDTSGNITIGPAATENVYITSTGVQIRDGVTVYTDLTAGVLILGEVGASKDNIVISAGAIAIRNNVTDRIGMTAAGILTINDSAGAAVITLDAALGAEITKKLTMPGANSAIAVGTTPPTSATAGTGIWLDRTGLYGLSANTQQFYMDASTGKALFAGGLGVIDLSGINLNGIRYALRHYATDSLGTNPRYGRFEMFYPEGKTIPALGVTFEDATVSVELVVNGGFETGDYTGWTTSGTGIWSITPPPSSPLAGVYSARWYDDNLAAKNGTLTSDRMLVTAASLYRFSADRYSLGCWVSIYVDWYDDPTAGALISTTTILAPSAVYGIISTLISSPTGAQSCLIRVYIANTSNGGDQCRLDSFSMQLSTSLRMLYFSPDLTYYDGLTSRKVLAGVKEIWTPSTPTISLVTTAVGNCTNGAHKVKIVYVDSDGKTLASAASNSVTVDAAHKQITVPLSLGPWGTLNREVYMTLAGGSVYDLAATIPDNTATSVNLSIADASLGVEEPQYNTTGSRPLFPRHAMVFANQILPFNSSGVAIPVNITNTANQVRFGFYLDMATADCHDGDRYQADMWLEAGTYSFTWYGVRSKSSGIVDLYVDGVSVSAGHDLYHADDYDYDFTVTNISVVGSCYHLIEWVVNGKNALSSDYRVTITYTAAKQTVY